MIVRVATPADLPALREIMRLAIEALQRGFLTPAEVQASHAVMGLDRQLIEDGTYLVAEDGDRIDGCGGWSRRATLYGGDHSLGLREPRLLDPLTEPARIRAMYTHPARARKGIGRRILEAAERAALAEGFLHAELMATLAGEPLYRAAGYRELERTAAIVDGVAVPLIRMRRSLV